MSEPAPAATDRSHRKCILLVDDEEDMLEFIREIIRTETPHTLISCRTAQQALAAASQLYFHLFILDYQLPDLDGLTLHDQLHTFAHLQVVPTIMISAYPPPFAEVHRRHITVQRKPFEVLRLLTSIEKALA